MFQGTVNTKLEKIFISGHGVRAELTGIIIFSTLYHWVIRILHKDHTFMYYLCD